MGNYCERLEIRLTLQQKAKLTEIASQQQLTLSQLIRQRILGEKPLRLKGIKGDIYNSLTRMGNNFNQVTKVLNYHSLVQKTVPASTIIELKESLRLAYSEIVFLKHELKR